MSARPPLITDHWFREGPTRPDGSDGYWICGYNGCSQHRGDHLQAEGHWLKPLHPFVPLVNYRPSYCRTCGRERRHTTHTPWLKEQYERARDKASRTEGKQRRCGYTKQHSSHTFMRLEVLFQCPGEHGPEGEQ